MLLNERSLVVVADGRQVRLFEERRRGGPLHERDEWSAGLTPSGRSGSRTHVVEPRDGSDPAEDRFLAAVAVRIAELTARHAFDSVVVIAPPRALGRIRSNLPTAARSRLRYTEAKERLNADLGVLQEALADLRRRGG